MLISTHDSLYKNMMEYLIKRIESIDDDEYELD